MLDELLGVADDCMSNLIFCFISNPHNAASCSIQDGKLPSNEGELRFPESPKHFYQNNQWVDASIPFSEATCNDLAAVVCCLIANKNSSSLCHCRLCVWTLLVPEGMHILLNFSHFDVESDMFCDYDSLSVYSKDDRLVGELLFSDSVKYFHRVLQCCLKL